VNRPSQYTKVRGSEVEGVEDAAPSREVEI
jgi:hypothetical protein